MLLDVFRWSRGDARLRVWFSFGKLAFFFCALGLLYVGRWLSFTELVGFHSLSLAFFRGFGGIFFRKLCLLFLKLAFSLVRSVELCLLYVRERVLRTVSILYREGARSVFC